MRARSAVIAFLLVVSGHAQQTAVLFIGNSYIYTNDLPYMFRQIALSLGDSVTTGMQAPGGYTLMDHTYDPATQDAIASQQWDHVVLQEQSQLGALPTSEGFTDVAAESLTYDIQLASECAYPVFYMTWGRKNGDAANCPWYPYMCTYEGMQQALRDNYVQLALDNEGYVSPVGWAWKQVRDTHPGIELYQADESHPSAEGTYLAACVFYCTIFKQSCTGASFTSTVQPDSAAILQAIASSTVLDSLDTWNLNEPGSTDATITGMSSDVWNQVTFHHFGLGSHWWICSDGQSSTDQEPTFTFAGPGSYTFTHVYIDPCGHMDTQTWTVEVYANGLAEMVADAFIVRPSAASTIEVTGSQAGTFALHDAAGRLLLTRDLRQGSTTIDCPAGLHFWRIIDTTGATFSGKVITY
jgi:uncharacterized protein DUF4886